MKDLTKGEVIGLIVAIAKKVSEQQATGIQSISWNGQTNSLIFTMSDGSTISTEISLDATDVPYSNTTSGLTATNIQAAIDELNSIKGVGQTYPNSTNGEIFNSYDGTNANIASGNYSHAEGYQTKATAQYSHAEGNQTTASGNYSHAEGQISRAGGSGSHAEGWNTNASGLYSHAEGSNTRARGSYSHAEGSNTTASADYAHAGGYDTIAGYDYQTAIGKYNNNKSTNLFEVGNGTSSSARSNAFEVSTDGVAYANGQQLATQEYVNNLIGGVSDTLGDTEDLGV